MNILDLLLKSNIFLFVVIFLSVLLIIYFSIYEFWLGIVVYLLSGVIFLFFTDNPQTIFFASLITSLIFVLFDYTLGNTSQWSPTAATGGGWSKYGPSSVDNSTITYGIYGKVEGFETTTTETTTTESATTTAPVTKTSPTGYSTDTPTAAPTTAAAAAQTTEKDFKPANTPNQKTNPLQNVGNFKPEPPVATTDSIVAPTTSGNVAPTTSGNVAPTTSGNVAPTTTTASTTTDPTPTNTKIQNFKQAVEIQNSILENLQQLQKVKENMSNNTKISIN